MTKLEEVLKDINKKYGSDFARKGVRHKRYSLLPFTSPRMNYMCYGGLPRGRIIEFSGEENGGKTTSLLDIIGNAQKIFKEEYETEITNLEQMPKRNKPDEERYQYLLDRGPLKVVFCDCENTYDARWAKMFNVDTDEMVVLKPQAEGAEQILQAILDIINTGEIGLCCLDSIGAMVSDKAYENDLDEKTFCGIAGPLTTFSKKCTMACGRTNCTFIAINQMRENIANPYDFDSTPGGKAWKHSCSLRLRFSKGELFDNKYISQKRSYGTPYGNYVDAYLVKSKVFPPDRRNGYYTLVYSKGVDVYRDALQTAAEYELIRISGGWYQLFDLDTGELLPEGKLHGENATMRYLEENTEYMQKLISKLEELISEVKDD